MYPELEVSFHHRDERNYGVELRFNDPDNSEAENFFGPFSIEFDWDRLRQQVEDAEAYGSALSSMFFHDAGVREAFVFAFAAAAQRDALRVRFNLSPSTPRLHDVLWETLKDPTPPHAPLATSERVLVSRFLSSWDSRPVHLRRKDVLRALVAIANPRGLGEQRVESRALAPILVREEWQRAKASLGSIGATRLSENGEASLDRIVASLRDGFDIFYLVCHGALVNGEPLLWLEDENGGIARIKGMDLVLRLKDMLRPPPLVVLASCQSAGAGERARSDDKGALAALGPRLAEAGIPAVIAMQDSVRMDTSSRFFSTFFRELAGDGQIDRALAVARSAIHREQPDWWVPVLITRLKRGRIWYEHDAAAEVSFQRWGSVVTDIGRSDCTPILGPALVASLLGSPVDIARRWAERYDFPMAPHERDSLPQVAQYLAYHQSRNFLHRELDSHIREFLLHTYSDKLSEGERARAKQVRLSDLITQIGRQLRKEDAQDPLRRLAALPFPIYVTANRDNLLFDALVEAGRRPKMEICRWAVFEEEQDAWPKSVFAAEPGEPRYAPSVEEPLVFHLFGHMSYPETLVLAEDDYFDFLIGVNKKRRSVYGSRETDTGTDPFPQVITTRALSKRSLLFIGFRVSDWEFRTLFRSILAQEYHPLGKEKSRRGGRRANVAVQMEPGEGEFLEPQGARRYIEEYLDPYELDVYWGSAKAFALQLFDSWHRAGEPVPTMDDLAR